jgi:hypothetical protein
VAALAEVLLRGLGLCGQALALGGAAQPPLTRSALPSCSEAGWRRAGARAAARGHGVRPGERRLPPAIDVTADRPTLGEVSAQFTPRWPRLTSPPIDQLPIDNPEAPRTDADRAWSEYNHHVAGLCVLAMGALAILHVS